MSEIYCVKQNFFLEQTLAIFGSHFFYCIFVNILRTKQHTFFFLILFYDLGELNSN